MQGIFEYAFGEEFEELEATVMKNLQADRGIQNIFTPIKDIEAKTGFKFSSVLNQDTKAIGILFNTEFVRYILKSFDEDYLNNVKITFFYDSQFDKKEVERIKVEYKYKQDIELISIEDFTEENKDIKVIVNAIGNKKFDVVFSNPPYGTKGNYLDLRILQELFKLSEKIVFIHPSGYLLDKKFKTKICNDIRNTNYLEYVNLFWGNKMFNILLLCPLCISVWNTKKSKNICEVTDNAFGNWTHSKILHYFCKINDISFYSNNIDAINLFNNIKKYINTHLKSIQDHCTNKNQLTDFSVKFSLIRGGNEYGRGIYSHFYSLIGKDFNSCKCDHTFRFNEKSHIAVFPHWSFNNEQERENFINYCKTKVVRFCLSFYKNTANLGGGELTIIPWMDFTQEWNDAKLCKEFNINEELWQYIDKFIPDYYDDYKSGF